MTLYNLRTTEVGWRITKFTDDLEVESTYEMHDHDGIVCTCPAAQRPTCRHRQMFDLVLERVDTPWFLDFDTRAWVDPTGEARREAETEEAASAASSSSSAILHTKMPTATGPRPGPQGSLGSDHPRAKHQSLQGWIDSGTINMVEGTPEPTPTPSLPDTHPFRRRL